MAFKIHQNEDDYFPLIKGHLLVLVSDLNEALKEEGLPQESRRRLCENFLLSHCEKLDQAWLRCEGQTYYPVIGFTKFFIDLNATSVPDNTILIGDKGNEFHTIVSELIEEYFDEWQETLPADMTGQISEELPDEEYEPAPDKPPARPCSICKGSGQCFCLRRGSKNSENCPRCGGHGKCQHCRGTGLSVS
jgi:hypothetical protein